MNGADDMDWNSIWKTRMEKRNRLVPVDCGSLWQRRDSAEHFWRAARKNSRTRLEITLADFELDARSRILDIGAGPGNLAIPFAMEFGHVTAVEPAEGMIRLLKENAAKKNIKNLKPVQKRWEVFDVETDLDAPCDLVIASFSLGMPDLKEAVCKMIESSAKYICLFWFAGTSVWEKHAHAIWSVLHNTPYIPTPKADVLFGMLYQMGIYPEMRVFPFSGQTTFSSLEEAVELMGPRFRVETEKQGEMLYDYFEKHMEKADGQFVQKNHAVQVKLWWRKNNFS